MVHDFPGYLDTWYVFLYNLPFPIEAFLVFYWMSQK